jgi:hypothetical protein
LLTAAGVNSSRAAAAVKLPLAADSTKDTKPCRLRMIFNQELRML